jgi:pimeloyl-ACP methyl ester carboxylesterase
MPSFTSRDGLELFYRDHAPQNGSAAHLPIVCIPGLTRNSADFEEPAAHLAAQGWRVLAPDLRGRGRSARDPNRRNYQPSVYARDMLDLLAHVGSKRAIFIGTSLGGLVTMALAAQKPGAVAAAILNDVGPQVAEEGLLRIRGYAGKQVEIASWADAIAYTRSIGASAFPHYDEATWERMTRRIFREDADGVPRPDYDPKVVPAFNLLLLRLVRPLLWQRFRRFARERRVLLLRGAISDLIDAQIADRMQREAPAMQRVDIPGVGHAPMLTEPAAVAAIDAFLRPLAGTR